MLLVLDGLSIAGLSPDGLCIAGLSPDGLSFAGLSPNGLSNNGPSSDYSSSGWVIVLRVLVFRLFVLMG